MRKLLSFLLIGTFLFSMCSCAPDAQIAKDPQNEQETDTITNELRETYFDFARTYRFDYIPEFEEGDRLEPEDLALYAAVRFWTEFEKGSGVKGSKIKEISGLFDMTRIPDENEIFPLGIGGVNGVPLMEAVSYQREQKDGKTYVTVDLKAHYFSDLNQCVSAEEQTSLISPYRENFTYPKNELAVYARMKDTDLTFFNAAKELIINGQGTQLEEVQTITRLCYETTDGKTPERFVSCKNIIL